jgi:hypothetical protein
MNLVSIHWSLANDTGVPYQTRKMTVLGGPNQGIAVKLDFFWLRVDDPWSGRARNCQHSSISRVRFDCGGFAREARYPAIYPIPAVN